MKFFASIGVLFIGAILLAAAGLARAFVGITLYRWFALPLGLPVLSMGQLFGLMYLIGIIWQIQPAKREKSEQDTLFESLALVIVGIVAECVFALFFGWCIKLAIS